VVICAHISGGAFFNDRMT